MSRQKYYDAKSMCPFAQYIDEEYICLGYGIPCKLGMYPNKYNCLDYNKCKSKYKTKTERSDQQWHQ